MLSALVVEVDWAVGRVDNGVGIYTVAVAVGGGAATACPIPLCPS